MVTDAHLPSVRRARPRIRWWWGLVALALTVIAGVFAFAIFQPVKVLPRMRVAPGFSLVDQNGQTVTSEGLRGTVTLYNFLYTGCGDACKDMNQTMQTVQAGLAAMDPALLQGMPVQFVTISFDPAHDTPEVLQAYAASLGADPARWRFASGDADRLKALIGSGFEVYYEPDGAGGYRFDPAFVLVDGWGIVRGKYRYQVRTPDSERILRHIGVLAEEVQKSTGANKLIYEAAHLFLCYAP